MPLGETWGNQRKLPQVFPKGRWAEGRASQLERQRENQARPPGLCCLRAVAVTGEPCEGGGAYSWGSHSLGERGLQKEGVGLGCPAED